MSQRTESIESAIDHDWKTTKEIMLAADLPYNENNRNRSTAILRRLVRYGLAERRTIGVKVEWKRV